MDPSTVSGWAQITDGSAWNIDQNNDWINAAIGGFFGGNAVLSLKILDNSGNTMLAEQHYYFRIAGENPDPAVCENFINATYNGPTQNWVGLTFVPGKTPPTVPGYWFAYAIAKEETAGSGGRPYYSQFLDNGGTYNSDVSNHPVPGKEGCPVWHNDSDHNGTGGYGLFQLTYEPNEPNFIMPRDFIWNWVTNVQQFGPIIQKKLQEAQTSVNGTRLANPSFFDPSYEWTLADKTSFNFWEAGVITRYNFGRGWYFRPAKGKTPADWMEKHRGQVSILDIVALENKVEK